MLQRDCCSRCGECDVSSTRAALALKVGRWIDYKLAVLVYR